MPLLDIRNLQLDFGRGATALRALDGVSLAMEPGETVCLVGESGSGKSVTALSIARLVPSPPGHYVGGEILLEGRDVLKLPPGALRGIRGSVVSYVFQDPAASLNPVFRVGTQILESLKLHRPAAATNAEVVRLLKQVGIPAPESRARNYPHELSGGMQQRVMIAVALASQPKLLIADEPTTALDVTIQAQMLALLLKLQRERGMALVLITHDLGVVAEVAERVIVMYAGQVIEEAAVPRIFERPSHPYTEALLAALPERNVGRRRLQSLGGVVPGAFDRPVGCLLSPRCPYVQERCQAERPALFELETSRGRCFFPLPSHAEVGRRP